MYSDLIYKMDELMIVSIKHFLKLPLQDKHFFIFYTIMSLIQQNYMSFSSNSNIIFMTSFIYVKGK